MFAGGLAVPRFRWPGSAREHRGKTSTLGTQGMQPERGSEGWGQPGPMGGDFKRWDGKGRCSIPASTPGAVSTNGICAVIREFIYQPLMELGKLNSRPSAAGEEFNLGQHSGAGPGRPGAGRAASLRGFAGDLFYFPYIRGFGYGIQLSAAGEGSGNCGDLTTKMGKVRHGQGKPKATH